MYISSADIMTRNQTRRVEVACPVESAEIKNALSEYLECLLADNTKARIMQPNGDYVRVERGEAAPVSVQEHYMATPLHLAPTIAQKPSFAHRIRFLNPFRRK